METYIETEWAESDLWAIKQLDQLDELDGSFGMEGINVAKE